MEEKLKQGDSNCIKIVLFGPESTGKTTLAKQLSRHYKTFWVPEYSRAYAERNLEANLSLTKDDVLPIAIGQMKLENELAQKTDSILICDTDLLETKVYAEFYYPNYSNPVLEKFAVLNSYDLYFLTDINIPWDYDGIRDKPNEREGMFKAFEDALIKYKKPYVLLKGNKNERFNLAVSYIDNLLNENDICFKKKT